MLSNLSVLGSKGDTRFSWDPSDPADCERMRATIATLKASGFSFFLTSGQPADELSGDPGGTLVVRKLTAEEVVPDPPAEDAPQPKRRGRPPKNPALNVVAVRPVRGG